MQVAHEGHGTDLGGWVVLSKSHAGLLHTVSLSLRLPEKVGVWHAH